MIATTWNRNVPPQSGASRSAPVEGIVTHGLCLTERDLAVATPTQAQVTAWQREAIRLEREYLRTGRPIHLLAFVRHVAGMLLRLREAMSI
jgi:hypothetical protein